MDSMARATIASASPAAIRYAASTIASSPEPQRRLTVNAGTRAGTPARSDATRATLTASGGCAMLPKTTSSRSAPSNPVRASTSTVTMRPRSWTGTSLSSVFAFAYGVRTPSTMTTSRDMRSFGGLVHPGDQVLVAALEDPPLDLQRRRDRTILHGQVDWQQRKGPDLLVVRLVLVVGVDLFLEERSQLRAGIDRRGLEGDVPLGRHLADPLEVGDDQGRQELVPVAEHDRQADVGGLLQLRLDRLGRCLLAAREHDQLFLAVRHREDTVGLELADIARVEPPLRIDRFGRGLGLVQVALHHVRSARQDLAV